jgi:P4 family phage/plasmid primase-like protien
MTESVDTTPAEPGPAPRRRDRRFLLNGSVTEMAEWLLGRVGAPGTPDFGALRGLVYASGSLWRCDPETRVWGVFDDAAAYAVIREFDGAIYSTPENKQRALQMSFELAKRVLRVIEAETAVPRFFSDAPTGLAFRNGFLRIVRDGGWRLEHLTPEHRATRQLPFDFEPDVRPESIVAWRAFLHSVWPTDPESVRLLHQMLGYLLSGDMSAQKIFLLLGPPRSGKGTIAKLLNRILGPACAPFSVSHLDNQFALAGLRNASVAIDGDVRRSKGLNTDESKIVKRLLAISSGDLLDVQLKNKEDLPIVLRCRLVMCSNPPFSIRDVGAALTTRIIILPFHVSHLGAEIYDLDARLGRELPGIIALAVQAYAQMCAAGARFAEPGSAAEMRQDIELGETPLNDFFDEWCSFEDSAARTPTAALYAAVQQWAQANGCHAPSARSVGAALKQKGIARMRPGCSAKGRREEYHYVGISLLAAPEVGAGDAAGLTSKFLGPKAPSGPAKVIPLRRPAGE